MNRVRKHLTVSNVLSGIALFAALGTGAAVALPGNGSVDSGDIKKNAVKAKHIAPSALKCPGNMRRVGGLCYDKEPRAEDIQLNSRYVCARAGRQLPSRAQLLRVAHTGQFPTGGGELWTESSDSNGNAGTIQKIASDNIPSFTRPVANNFAFHCVREALP